MSDTSRPGPNRWEGFRRRPTIPVRGVAPGRQSFDVPSSEYIRGVCVSTRWKLNWNRVHGIWMLVGFRCTSWREPWIVGRRSLRSMQERRHGGNANHPYPTVFDRAPECRRFDPTSRHGKPSRDHGTDGFQPQFRCLSQSRTPPSGRRSENPARLVATGECIREDRARACGEALRSQHPGTRAYRGAGGHRLGCRPA